ncbi:hypothetical protein V6N13_024196 [Hibiscus sabdariffa]|uniref:Uncharacterized protein n=1 Tax=Hibiscus sabdariffa TaxID=183260 RepID=A0ABR2BWS1_9ROSI
MTFMVVNIEGSQLLSAHEPRGDDLEEVQREKLSSLSLGDEEVGFHMVTADESQSCVELVDKVNNPGKPPSDSLELNDKPDDMFP